MHQKVSSLRKERRINAPQTQLLNAQYRLRGNHQRSLLTQSWSKDFYFLDCKRFGVTKFSRRPLEFHSERKQRHWKITLSFDIHGFYRPRICSIPMAVKVGSQIHTRFNILFFCRFPYARSYDREGQNDDIRLRSRPRSNWRLERGLYRMHFYSEPKWLSNCTFWHFSCLLSCLNYSEFAGEVKLLKSHKKPPLRILITVTKVWCVSKN